MHVHLQGNLQVSTLWIVLRKIFADYPSLRIMYVYLDLKIIYNYKKTHIHI